MLNSNSKNFSFTLNASDSGDFIQKKVLQSSKKVKLSASNLKTIGEELERVSNRLASSKIDETTNKDEASSIDLCSSLIKPGPRALLHLDETLSSISSSDTTGGGASSDSKLKPTKASKNNDEKKNACNSLTSTPSKL